ncbi:winged helix-turn-helix transcriptional regulator [Candidatus Parcubacteria bacterium]|nr:MAG: winged helix-turn-helix transcriptional regulator [Candidatus Parcubacteria bacterium]
MNHKEIKTLKIMEALEYDQVQSQRDLADKLGISLGLVNALLKTLVKKGHFKIRTIPKSRVKYLLTSEGAAEKSLLTYRYINYSLTFYRDIQNMFRSLFSTLTNEGKERIVLFGKGELSEIASAIMKKNNFHLVDIIDQVSQLDGLDYDVILILELENYAFIESCLLNGGLASQKILRL